MGGANDHSLYEARCGEGGEKGGGPHPEGVKKKRQAHFINEGENITVRGFGEGTLKGHKN